MIICRKKCSVPPFEDWAVTGINEKTVSVPDHVNVGGGLPRAEADMEKQRFVVIIDMSDWKMYHGGYTRYLIQLVKIVQDCFPERLHCAFILNSPTIFWAVWKVLSPLVQERTRNKLKWINVKPGDRWEVDQCQAGGQVGSGSKPGDRWEVDQLVSTASPARAI